MEREIPITAPRVTSSWPINAGSLDDVVTCESSYDCELESQEVVSRNNKEPLILGRPSPPDSVPCQITIEFSQLHEIKQIYIRSTGRVYEVYYASDSNSDNQYLCTVRCGLAAAVTNHPDAIESLSSEDHSRTDSGGSTNEDGWVDIKSQTSSSILSSLPHTQDFFEATAEISDADPVLSVTLRLLSIQTGDYVCVDEVFVFADPVVETESNSPPTSQETSSGAVMMSMFLPTLLQLSKSRTSKMQEQNGSLNAERSVYQDTQHNLTGVASTSHSVPKDIGTSSGICHQEVPIQTPIPQDKPHPPCRENYYPCSNIEQTLQELVSRVSRIEDFCLRFEENMLKPISNMETRLERVEQQLDSLNKTPQFPTGGTRYSAPEFPCHDSESNSIDTGGNGSPGICKPESSKEGGDCLEELCILTADAYSCPDARPGLVVSAPDFSYADDEEENDSVKALKDCPEDTPIKPISIDDALASAIAGFMSSVITKAVEPTHTVEEAEVCSIVEGSGSGNGTTSSSAISSPSTRPLGFASVVEEAENFSSIEGSRNVSLSALNQSDEDGGGEVAIETINLHDQGSDVEDTKKPSGLFLDVSLDGLGNMSESDSESVIEARETDVDTNRISISDYCDAPLVDNVQLKMVSGADLEIHGGKMDSSLGGGITKGCRAILQDIIESPSPAMVDFNAPVLDVTFSSSDNFTANSSLEALLVDKPDLGSEVPCVGKEDAMAFSEQYDLVIIDNEASGDAVTFNNQLLCFDNGDSGYVPSESEEELQDSYICSPQDMSASLI